MQAFVIDFVEMKREIRSYGSLEMGDNSSFKKRFRFKQKSLGCTLQEESSKG